MRNWQKPLLNIYVYMAPEVGINSQEMTNLTEWACQNRRETTTEKEKEIDTWLHVISSLILDSIASKSNLPKKTHRRIPKLNVPLCLTLILCSCLWHVFHLAYRCNYQDRCLWFSPLFISRSLSVPMCLIVWHPTSIKESLEHRWFALCIMDRDLCLISPFSQTYTHVEMMSMMIMIVVDN